jgi:hypothetical protein
MDVALQRLQADPTLSRADRVSALTERVALVRLDLGKDEIQPRLPPALLADVRETAQRMDRETTDGYERQAVMTAPDLSTSVLGVDLAMPAILSPIGQTVGASIIEQLNGLVPDSGPAGSIGQNAPTTDVGYGTGTGDGYGFGGKFPEEWLVGP